MALGAPTVVLARGAPSFCTKISTQIFFVDLHKNSYNFVTPEMLQKFNKLQNCNNCNFLKVTKVTKM